MTGDLQRSIDDVLARDACSGCGLCTRLDAGLEMALDESGYLRPRRVAASAPVPGADAIFRRSCPGVVVAAPSPPEGSMSHPIFGAHLGMWEAWAVDDEIRRAGSSGGALTALHTWLLSSGRASRIAGAAMDEAAPRRSVPVTITSRADALRAAGSRYAPVATLASDDVLLPGTAVTGKPCEIAALRAAAADLVDGETPLLLSFFCAGTPSQLATDSLLATLGVERDEHVDALRYRGDGWPGSFAATAGERVVSVDYDTSWGQALGPTTQWRCKMCVDGVGEAADVVSADSWETDERGYPSFAEGAGTSALIARTERGAALIRDAEAAGVLTLRPLASARLTASQPLQVDRRTFLLARLIGSQLAGRRPPRFRGYRLAWLTMRSPRIALRAMRGTYRRVRTARGGR